ALLLLVRQLVRVGLARGDRDRQRGERPGEEAVRLAFHGRRASVREAESIAQLAGASPDSPGACADRSSRAIRSGCTTTRRIRPPESVTSPGFAPRGLWTS